MSAGTHVFLLECVYSFCEVSITEATVFLWLPYVRLGCGGREITFNYIPMCFKEVSIHSQMRTRSHDDISRIFITNIPVSLGTSNKWPRQHGNTPSHSKLSHSKLSPRSVQHNWRLSANRNGVRGARDRLREEEIGRSDVRSWAGCCPVLNLHRRNSRRVFAAQKFGMDVVDAGR